MPRLTREQVENHPTAKPFLLPDDPFAPPTQQVGFDAVKWLEQLKTIDPQDLGLNYYGLSDTIKIEVARVFPAYCQVLPDALRSSLKQRLEETKDTREALLQAEAGMNVDAVLTTEFEASLDDTQNAEVKHVEWVVGPYIPKGFLTILGGDTGVGKSQLALWFAAKAWHLSQHRTIYVAGEDPVKHITWPRILATQYAGKPLPIANGEEGAIYVIDPEEHGKLSFDDEAGFLKLFIRAQRAGYSMIILDPLVSFHARGVRSNNAEQMREMLEPVKAMAAEYGIAVLLCAHISKGSGQYVNPLNVIRGSSDLAAIARGIIYCGQHPDNEPQIDEHGESSGEVHAFGHVKSNIGKRGAVFAYEFESVEVSLNGVKAQTSRVNVMPDPEQSVNIFELVNANMKQIKKAEAEARDRDKANPKAQQAVEEVYEHLTIFDGTFAKDMQESMAAKHGIARDTLKKALASDPRFLSKSGAKGGFYLPPVSE